MSSKSFRGPGRSRVLLAFFLAACSVLAGPSHGADLSIVIDDSKGMCGYLAETDSGYRRLLHRLQGALQETGVSVELHRLSQLSRKGSPSGGSLDAEAKRQLNQIEQAAKCNFNLEISPLHLAHRVAGKKLTLLISDMIFDLGAEGAIKSSSEFTDGLDAWSNSVRARGLDAYFKASTGLIGFRSDFRNTYFTQLGKPIEFKANVSRPFYVFWKSTDNEFSARILRALAAKEVLDKDKGFAVSFAPYLAVTGSFVFKRPSYSADLLPLSTPAVLYEFIHRKARYDAFGKVSPHECFATAFAKSPATVFFDKRCGNDSNSRNVAFRGVDDLLHALIVIRTDDVGSIRRSISAAQPTPGHDLVLRYLHIEPNTALVPDMLVEKDDKGKPTGVERENFGAAVKGCGSQGKLDCWVPRKKAEEIAREGGNFLVLQISRGSGKLNSENPGDPKKAIYSGSWFEKFEAAQEDDRMRSLDGTIAGWSTDKEPEVCAVPEKCPQNSRTIGLSDFLKALSGRLDATTKVVDLLNADTDKHPLGLQLLWSGK